MTPPTPSRTFRTILAAVDSSPRAAAVVATAVDVAERYDATVHLFRVVTLPPEFPAAAHSAPDDLPDVLREHARQELVALGGGDARIVIETPELGAREPWRAILDEARRIDAGLIVIGSHGYSGWDRVLGTVAGKVANHADRDVLVVHLRPPSAQP